MVKKQLDFAGFLESENLYCDLSQAVYFDHWVTPDMYSMRFDTRFYAAVLPSGQVPLDMLGRGDAQSLDQAGGCVGAHEPARLSDLAADHDGVAGIFPIPSWEHLSTEFKFSR